MKIWRDDIDIPCGRFYLSGILQIPTPVSGIVLFAHGSGSSRFSQRNQSVAEHLNQAGIATLLFDLLTPEEEQADEITREHRFNIELLTTRLIAATDWTRQQSRTQDLPIGYFGASTGAAAALQAAAKRSDCVKAVVCRGGRSDLAGALLSQVEAPTLLIVGELDTVVIELNEAARSHMHGVVKLEIVAGATHLFEEAGTLNEVARLTEQWFNHYF